jgi:flagellar M-ring protein FliF
MDKLMEETRGLLHSQPELMKTVLMGVCGILVVLFVLRPVARQVAATLREPVLLTAGSGATNGFEMSEKMFAPPSLDEEEIALPRVKNKNLHQGIFENVSEHIRREPAQSTRVLEAWIGTPEENG